MEENGLLEPNAFNRKRSGSGFNKVTYKAPCDSHYAFCLRWKWQAHWVAFSSGEPLQQYPGLIALKVLPAGTHTHAHTRLSACCCASPRTSTLFRPACYEGERLPQTGSTNKTELACESWNKWLRPQSRGKR